MEVVNEAEVQSQGHICAFEDVVNDVGVQEHRCALEDVVNEVEVQGLGNMCALEDVVKDAEVQEHRCALEHVMMDAEVLLASGEWRLPLAETGE